MTLGDFRNGPPAAFFLEIALRCSIAGVPGRDASAPSETDVHNFGGELVCGLDFIRGRCCAPDDPELPPVSGRYVARGTAAAAFLEVSRVRPYARRAIGWPRQSWMSR
jgi:hypothetical protein